MEKTKKHLGSAPFFIILFLSFLNNSLSYTGPVTQLVRPPHVVLVHGAGHGAWCWFKLIPLLRSSGYNVTAIDLAASGINPLQITDIKTISDYFAPLTNLLASLPANERIMLVGHNFGGFAISQAMEKFPNKIGVAVFITAFMPGPSLDAFTVFQEENKLLGDLQDTTFTFGEDPNNPIAYTIGPMFLRSRLYQLSPIEDWTLATTLIRAAHLLNQEDFSSGELDVTREKYGTVKRVFVITEKDLILPKQYQEFMIRGNPPNQVEEILGSDHMVMMSKPRELCDVLLRIAVHYFSHASS